jgi:SulP family sulfate permease
VLIDLHSPEIESKKPDTGESTEPFNTLFKAFACYGDLTRDEFEPMFSLLERVAAPEGLVLWRQGEDSDSGLYIIESGILRASYVFADYTPRTEESMVPGTLAGELSALSGMPRNSTVTVEREAVLWKLSIENLRRLEVADPGLASKFVQLVLKGEQFKLSLLFDLSTDLFSLQRLRLTMISCCQLWQQDSNVQQFLRIL